MIEYFNLGDGFSITLFRRFYIQGNRAKRRVGTYWSLSIGLFMLEFTIGFALRSKKGYKQTPLTEA